MRRMSSRPGGAIAAVPTTPTAFRGDINLMLADLGLVVLALIGAFVLHTQ